MKKSRVLEKAKRGEAALGVCLHLTDPSLFEMTSLMGFDAIWMDMEHHFYSLETAANLMRAARVGGTDIVARPAKGEFGRMARMLEAGATGIMYPRCDSAAEAKEVVKWGKFAPIGKRGFDGSGPDVPYILTPMTRYIREANDETFLLIQMEEPHAVEQAEAIAATPGVDMIMLGPADFTVLTGVPGEFGHPTVLAAIERIAKAAKNTGKYWAATCGSMEQAKRYVDMGASLLFHGCDIVFVKAGLEAVRQAAAEQGGFKFGSGKAEQSSSYLGGR